jgi:hypothetical protein
MIGAETGLYHSVKAQKRLIAIPQPFCKLKGPIVGLGLTCEARWPKRPNRSERCNARPSFRIILLPAHECPWRSSAAYPTKATSATECHREEN